jgi:hypothetical protein
MGDLQQHDKHLIGLEEFRTFMFQGRARFTLENKKTGNYIKFTVKARKTKRNQPEETRFFNVYTAVLDDKVNGKVEIGEIDRVNGRVNPKEGIKSDYLGLKTTIWLVQKWRELEKYEDLKIYHLNVCCKCGMELTVPESIKDGIGPICVRGRMLSTIDFIRSLGTDLVYGPDYTLPDNYDLALTNAISRYPHMLDKFFIPARVREQDGFTSFLYELEDYGLW